MNTKRYHLFHAPRLEGEDGLNFKGDFNSLEVAEKEGVDLVQDLGGWYEIHDTTTKQVFMGEWDSEYR